MRLAFATLLSGSAAAAFASDALPTRNYDADVCAESDDVVELVRFAPGGLERLKQIPVGSFPAETEPPHAISLSPDGKHWFVSISHGCPWAPSTSTDRIGRVGDVTVGMFPATLAVSPSTGLLFVVNFDLYGDMTPSTVSVVETATTFGVARIPVGIMPHGARMDAKGSKLYIVNMMNDELLEIDALRFEVAWRRPLVEREEASHAGHGAHGGAERGEGVMCMEVQPTWVTAPSADGRVYVTGNSNDVIYEVDLATWKLTRRFEGTGAGPYNMDVPPTAKR